MRSSLFSLLSCLVYLLCPHGLSAEKITIAPHTFTIPEGYALKRVAAPPLVQRPIHMCFDDDGVLYVTDSSGNTAPAPAQLKDPKHRVLRLVDRDGDGGYLMTRPCLPSACLFRRAFWSMRAPSTSLPRLTFGNSAIPMATTSRNERSIWFDGGSITGCGNDLHGPYLGPDGYFYWCKRGRSRRRATCSEMGRPLTRARPISFVLNLTVATLDVVITGGMDNPVGLAFSESGERFVSGTFFDLSKPGRRDGILHAVYGGMWGKKHDRVLSPHPRTGDLLPILAQMGPAAPSGLVMPKHDALGLRGDLLCADFNLRRISRHELSRKGSSYSAATSSFIER